jgi:hypothetical protein
MAGRADFSPKQRIGFAAASYAARAYTRVISATGAGVHAFPSGEADDA